MNDTRSALIVSTKHPYPSDDGKKVVLRGLVDYFLERLGADKVCYVVLDRRERWQGRPLDCRTEWLTPPGRLRQIGNLLRNALTGSRQTLQEAVTFAPHVGAELERLIAELAPDILIVDSIRIGQYFHDGPRHAELSILYMDDLLYLRYATMLRSSREQPDLALDPAGTFAKFIPAAARRLLRVGFVQRLLFRREMRAAERRELASTADFDRCLLVNPVEADILQQRCPQQTVLSVKPLLHTEPCRNPRRFDGRPSFLLFGSLRHPAHRASVIHFLRQHMPAVLEAIPEVELQIIGGGADDPLLRLARGYGSHVAVRGFVEDIDEVFATSCAMIVPLLFGGGLKLKSLTALYHGLPLISTDAGVDGLQLRDGVDFIRENELRRFPEWMRKLCEPQYNRRISENAAQAFVDGYSREAVYADYDRIFARPRPAGALADA